MDKETEKILFKISSNSTVNFLRYKPYFLERDVYNIISVVFNIESAFRLKKNIEYVEIPISNESFDFWGENVKEIEKEIRELIRFVILSDVEVRLIKKNTNKGRQNKKIEISQCNYICLFSGGVDSLTGLTLTLKKYPKQIEALSIIHGDQGKMIQILNGLYSKINLKLPFNLNIMHAPPMYSKGYSQLRGFFYVLSGSIYANLKNANKIFITECGPTMYQMRFSPIDSITMTTHPFVLSKSKKLSELFFRKKIEFVIPFENLTKAEVAKLNPFPELFKISHSCIGMRWIGTDFQENNDGTCYGCVVRRLGLLVAGLVDANYEKNPIINEEAPSDNLSNLLAFSSEFLIDWEGMEYCQLENIREYNKHKLFRKFSLDNIAALYLLKQSGVILSPHISTFYDEAIGVIGEPVLIKRIKKVRGGKYYPDFDKRVK